MTADRSRTARTIDDLRAEIARADAKASVLVAAMGLSFGMPLGPASHPDGGAFNPAWSLAWLAWLASLGALLMVLTPRYHRGSWAAERRTASIAGFRRRPAAGGPADLVQQDTTAEHSCLLATAAELSRIVLLKYRWTRASLACFTLAMTMTTVMALT